jgi:hypothetical protein
VIGLQRTRKHPFTTKKEENKPPPVKPNANESDSSSLQTSYSESVISEKSEDSEIKALMIQ